MQYSGARILLEALIEQGVDTVFGFPGGSVLFIYDELYRYRHKIRHILVSHEQHAAHAADGYARSSGKPGVCLATSGPGATNLVTGIATAYMDSIPLVAITGNVALSLLGKDSFQEVDIAGVTMPVVKHNWIVKDVNELAEVVREAFIVALSGRPGPVLIDLPKDITAQRGTWTARRRKGETACSSALGARAGRLEERSRRATYGSGDIDAAVRLLASAKRPLLYAGGGVIGANAGDELAALAERLSAPVALSLMGMGALPKEHRLCTGLIGMHGTVASNKAVQRADLLVAIGARFSDRVTSRADTFAKNARILHFDIDPAEINKNIKTDAWVVGNIKESLAETLKRLPRQLNTEWDGELEKWKAHIPRAHRPGAGKGLHPRFIIEETARRLGREAVVVTDVGQHQMWAAQFYPFHRPRSFITSGGLGTMGFGLGAALGAKIAEPERPVVLFTGDGSFRMNCAELATLQSCGIPVLIIIFNNHTLGMVRQWQNLFYEKRYFATDMERPPDFVKLAEAYGLPGFRAADEAAFALSLDAAMKALAGGSAVLVEAQLDKDEMVLPMVPGGKPVDEQILQGGP